jgi:hypothetical protein
MITDSYYEIGSSHLYCQDYATHGSFPNYQGEEIFYAVIADGCSSAMDSDIGARVLALAAVSVVKNIFGTSLPPYYPYYKSMGKQILSVARITQKLLDISSECLYSTLLIAVCGPRFKFAAIYGDGFIVLEKENHFEILNMDFPSNAPYYLAYRDNPVEQSSYKKEFGGKGNFITSYWMKGATEPDEDTKFSRNVSCDFDCLWEGGELDKIKSISLFTDGIGTFRLDKGMCRDDIETEKVISDILSFKGVRGEFLQRQMIWYKKVNLKEGIHHYDDLGCATIIMEEENEVDK